MKLKWIAKKTPKGRASKVRWRLNCAAGEWELAIRNRREGGKLIYAIWKINQVQSRFKVTVFEKYKRLEDGGFSDDIRALQAKMIEQHVEPLMKLKYLEELV
jgi:hypothetical protein